MRAEGMNPWATLVLVCTAGMLLLLIARRRGAPLLGHRAARVGMLASIRPGGVAHLWRGLCRAGVALVVACVWIVSTVVAVVVVGAIWAWHRRDAAVRARAFAARIRERAFAVVVHVLGASVAWMRGQGDRWSEQRVRSAAVPASRRTAAVAAEARAPTLAMGAAGTPLTFGRAYPLVPAGGGVTTTAAPALCPSIVHRPDPLNRPDFGLGLMARTAARESDLLERGIVALEAGHDAEAYELFKHAVELNPRGERAWFWRARTARTLSEVVECLEQALAIDPSNEKVRLNLVWARGRSEREELTAEAGSQMGARLGPSGSAAAVARMRAGTVRTRTRQALAAGAALLLALTRAAGTIAAVVLGAAWIAGGLPADLRGVLEGVNTAGEALHALPIVDAAAVAPRFGALALGGSGYNALLGVPYALGFFALLVAAGLRNRERWTRVWGPLLAAGSAALWLAVFGLTPNSMAIALCALVALAGLATPSDQHA